MVNESSFYTAIKKNFSLFYWILFIILLRFLFLYFLTFTNHMCKQLLRKGTEKLFGREDFKIQLLYLLLKGLKLLSLKKVFASLAASVCSTLMSDNNSSEIH